MGLWIIISLKWNVTGQTRKGSSAVIACLWLLLVCEDLTEENLLTLPWALTMWALGWLLSAVLCFRQPGRGGAGYKERLVVLNGPWQKGILVSFSILILGILTSLYSRHLFLHSSWGGGGAVGREGWFQCIFSKEMSMYLIFPKNSINRFASVGLLQTSSNHRQAITVEEPFLIWFVTFHFRLVIIHSSKPGSAV